MLNWAIGIDMYTLMCIKLMPNKNLQYKKTNKTKNKTKQKNPSTNGRLHHDQDKRNKPIIYFKISIQERLPLLAFNQHSTMNVPEAL